MSQTMSFRYLERMAYPILDTVKTRAQDSSRLTKNEASKDRLAISTRHHFRH